jgi:ABC-2 type transport system permease protein/lipopolysaccharide transport system permease protein
MVVIDPTREPETEPPAEIRFRRKISMLGGLRELWANRELVRTLAERELRARYKQAALGFAWAMLVPLALMVVFTVFFNRVAQIDTNGVPYALFSYVALVPWAFFSQAVNIGGLSLVNNNQLLNKVYCPREVFPLAGTSVALVIYGFAPKATSVWVPVLLLIQLAFTTGLVMLLSGLIVYIRDIRHTLPILLQLGLFATPVAYGIDAIPPSFLRLYATINPLVGVIDGYRRTILFGEPPDWGLVLPGAVTSFVLLIAGYHLFKRMETNFADVA